MLDRAALTDCLSELDRLRAALAATRTGIHETRTAALDALPYEPEDSILFFIVDELDALITDVDAALTGKMDTA